MFSKKNLLKISTGLLVILGFPINIFATFIGYSFSDQNDYVFNSNLIEVDTNEARLKLLQEFQINDLIESLQAGPGKFLPLSDGNIFVIFQSNAQVYPADALAINSPDNSFSHVAGKIIDQNGQTVIPEFQINDYISGLQSQPSATLLNNGNIFVVYSSQDPTTGDNDGGHIAGKILGYNGTSMSVVVPEFRINQFITGSQTLPSAVTLDNGNVLVTYNSQGFDGNGFAIAARVYEPNGTPNTAEFLVNDLTTGDQTFSHLKKLINGNVVVCFNSAAPVAGVGGDNSGTHIAAKILNSNNPAGAAALAEIQVNTTILNDQTECKVEQLSNGNILFVWQSADLSLTDSRAAGIVLDQSGSIVIPEFTLSQNDDGSQRPAAILRTANGNIFLTFTSNAAIYDSTDLIGRIISEDATSFLSNEFIINDFTNNNQLGTAIANISNNHIIIGWTSNDTTTGLPDNQNSYVAGKILAQNGQEIYPQTSPTIQPNASHTVLGELISFSDFSPMTSLGNVTYQLSQNNGANWMFHDGANWVNTTNGVTDSNSSADIDNNIQTFPGSTILWRAFLTSPTGFEFTAVQNVGFRDNRAPVITSEGGANIVNINLNIGETFISTITASDPDGDSFTIQNSPMGPDASEFAIFTNVFGDTQLIISPSPASSANPNGTYEVSIIVEDTYGASTTQTFFITFNVVTPPPPTPPSSTPRSGSSSSRGTIINPFANNTTPSTPTRNDNPAIISETCDYEMMLKDIEQFQDFQQEISRLEAVKYVLLINCLGLEELPEGNQYPFSDINLSDTEAARILYTAHKRGIVKGYPDGTFKSDQTINYVELLAINSRAQNLAKDNQETGSDWFKNYINLNITIDLAIRNVKFGDPITGTNFYNITKRFLSLNNLVKR